MKQPNSFFSATFVVFAIRRKRKEATHHVIEVKLPSDMDSPHLSGVNANSSNKNITSSSIHPSKLLPQDVIIDLEDIENEPVFSSSGDALLGREPGSAQKAILGPTGLFANHNWDRKTSPAVPKAFGLSANSKSPSTKSGKSRNALFRHQQIQQQQQRAQRGTWQSDVNLIQHSQCHSSRGKLRKFAMACCVNSNSNFTEDGDSTVVLKTYSLILLTLPRHMELPTSRKERVLV